MFGESVLTGFLILESFASEIISVIRIDDILLDNIKS